VPEVVITGWRPGLLKVSMTTTIREHTELGLAESKRVTDRVLDGESVVLPSCSAAAADALAAELARLGAVVEVRDDPT
jgi:ribosomal protein L7/L12